MEDAAISVTDAARGLGSALRMATPSQSIKGPQRGMNLLSSSAYFGSGTAALGGTIAAAHATIRGKRVVLYTVDRAVQCFMLGSIFWFTRSALRNSDKDIVPSARADLVYSSAAGAMTGMVGGALRGRVGSVLPGAIVCGLVGLGGQCITNGALKLAEAPSQQRPLLDKLSDSKWWPLKSISDAQYERDLEDKVIALDAEIAMIDEKIAGLKQKLPSLSK